MHVLNKVPNIPPSVNPMEMTDEEFAKYRKIGDDIVSGDAATAMAMLDHKYIQTNLAKLSKNNQKIPALQQIFQHIPNTLKKWGVCLPNSTQTPKNINKQLFEHS